MNLILVGITFSEKSCWDTVYEQLGYWIGHYNTFRPKLLHIKPHSKVYSIEYIYKCMHYKNACSSSSWGQKSTCDS